MLNAQIIHHYLPFSTQKSSYGLAKNWILKTQASFLNAAADLFLSHLRKYNFRRPKQSLPERALFLVGKKKSI